MKIINKIKVFKEELSWIQNDEIRKFTEKAISLLPDYFFEVAASSTGKYHPKYALENGGLIRHTKAAVAIAKDLLTLEMYGKYSQEEKDIMLAALILHDGMKHGESKSIYTIAEHPTIVVEWIINNGELNNILSQKNLNLLTGCIASHMGEFNTDYKTKKEILPKPKTAMQKMVHMCDYLASRKYLEFDFGDIYYNPEYYSEEDTRHETDELKEIILKILDICKSKVSDGVNKTELFQLISDRNNGNKNPNSILDIQIAKDILCVLEEM